MKVSQELQTTGISQYRSTSKRPQHPRKPLSFQVNYCKISRRLRHLQFQNRHDAKATCASEPFSRIPAKRGYILLLKMLSRVIVLVSRHLRDIPAMLDGSQDQNARGIPGCRHVPYIIHRHALPRLLWPDFRARIFRRLLCYALPLIPR